MAAEELMPRPALHSVQHIQIRSAPDGPICGCRVGTTRNSCQREPDYLLFAVPLMSGPGPESGLMLLILVQPAGPYRSLAAPRCPSRLCVFSSPSPIAHDLNPACQGADLQTLSPGYIRTAMTDALLAQRPDFAQQWTAGSMLERLSTPDEFRGPVIYLLSRASSFMTGADLIVDGGHTAW